MGKLVLVGMLEFFLTWTLPNFLHSIYYIVGIIGIMKAGGAFLSVDPEHSEERIKYMIEIYN